jgi:putative SOS response-associated peptidase YedK
VDNIKRNSQQLTSAKYRQPFFVRLIDRSVAALAAIWDRFVGEDDDVIETCSVICVPANDLMAKSRTQNVGCLRF